DLLWRRRLGQRGAAREAELRDVGVIRAALRADRHRRSVPAFPAEKGGAAQGELARGAPHGPFTPAHPNPPRKGTSATSYWTNTRGSTITHCGRAASMSAAELEVLFESEIHRIENWRHGALERAGYDREGAVVLAASHVRD